MILLILLICALISIIGIIKGCLRGLLSIILIGAIAGIAWHFYQHRDQNPVENIQQIIQNKTQETQAPASQTDYYVDRLTDETESTTDEFGNLLGSAQFGAKFVVGSPDELGRPTFAHILVSDAQEPGQNGLKRAGKINTNPAGWRNYKLKNNWANDRTHMVGYQFSGVNDYYDNLVTATRYLNRGVEGNGTDENNPDGMLYYEQRLDSWLSTHPNYRLDYYVKPLYEGNGLILKQMYMQWVGVDENGNTIPIEIGGHSQATNGDARYVLLTNQSPSYNIDYQTGQVTLK